MRAVKILTILALFSFPSIAKSIDIVKDPMLNSGKYYCPDEYILIKDVCVNINSFSDIEAVRKAISQHKRGAVASSLTREPDEGGQANQRVVPFPASGYLYSRDGSSVACTATFSSYAISRDGSDVCCGGEYNGWQDSRDGKKVCVGGLFNGCVHSIDGSYVECGGWGKNFHK